VAERQIPAEDLYKLKLWRETEPEAPPGPWYKDFGSFKICGDGEFPNEPARPRLLPIGCTIPLGPDGRRWLRLGVTFPS
jgi:hypothetical protein